MIPGDRLLRRALSTLIVHGFGLALDVLQAMDRSLDEGDGSDHDPGCPAVGCCVNRADGKPEPPARHCAARECACQCDPGDDRG